MVKATATPKFPAALVTQRDIGLFTNNVGANLTQDAAIGDTTLDVQSTTGIEADMWWMCFTKDGLLVGQVSAVNADLKQVTVTRPKDGTTDIDLKQGASVLFGVSPALALNQLAAEVVAIEAKVGTLARTGTEGGLLFADASGNWTQDATNLFWHDATNQLRLVATGSGAGLLIGGDAHWYRGAANRMDLATGDTLHLVDGALTSGAGLTLTPATGANLNLAVAGAGGVQIAGTTVFEADRDLAISLTPSADNALTSGTSSRRWSSSHAVAFRVEASSGDAQPSIQLVTGALEIGPGGATAPDTRIERSGADALRTPDSWDAGSLLIGGVTVLEADRDVAVHVIPNADNGLNLGSSTRRWAITHALTYDVLVGPGDANPVTRLSSSGVAFGAGGAAALDGLIERSGADALRTPDSWDAGSLLIGGIMVMEADRDLAISLLPTTTNSLDLGSSGRQWRDLHLAGNLNIGGTTVFQGDRDLAIDLLPEADNNRDLGSNSRRFVNLHLSGGTQIGVRSVSTSPVTLAFEDRYVTVDSSGGTRTVNLPASPITGEEHEVKRNGANNVTLDGNGKNIEAATTYTLEKDDEWAKLVYTGTIWELYGAPPRSKLAKSFDSISDQTALGFNTARQPSTTKDVQVIATFRMVCGANDVARVHVKLEDANPPTRIISDPSHAGGPTVVGDITERKPITFTVPAGWYYLLDDFTSGTPTLELLSIWELS